MAFKRSIIATLLAFTLIGAAAPAGAAGKRSINESVYWMALTMYYEARNQPLVGWIAVGWVVLNRVDSHHFPNSVKAVVTQRRSGRSCQFYFYCDGKAEKPLEQDAWQTAQKLARRLLSPDNTIMDPTGGALYYYATWDDPPYWAAAFDFTVRIFDHAFFSDPKNKPRKPTHSPGIVLASLSN